MQTPILTGSTTYHLQRCFDTVDTEQRDIWNWKLANLEQCQGMLPLPSNPALQILGCPMRLLGLNAALVGLQIKASTLQSGQVL